MITRNKAGWVKFSNREKGPMYYYTLDGSIPSTDSKKYQGPFKNLEPVQVKAIAYDATTNRQSQPTSVWFDIAKERWKVVGQNISSLANQAIDGDIASNYELSSVEIDQGFVINLGEVHELQGFTYTPDQSRWPSGIITHYDCYLSTNGKTWRLAVNGEFSNIINNPVEQNVRFSEIIKARFIKLKVKKIREGDQKPIIAEFGVVTN